MRTFFKIIALCFVGSGIYAWLLFDPKPAEDCSQTEDRERQFIGCTKLIEHEAFGNVGAAYRNRGQIYRSRKDLANALRDFNSAIKEDPTRAANYVTRAAVYGQLDDYPRMKDNLDEAKRLGADDKDYNLTLALYLVETRKYADARAIANRFRTEDKTDGLLFQVLALACKGLKDWTCGIDAANTAIMAGNKAVAHATLANILIDMANIEKDQPRKIALLKRAMAAFDSALKIDPADTDFRRVRNDIESALKKAGRL